MKSSSAAVSVVVARRACAVAVLGAASAAWAGYEVPSAAYNPPTHYYDAAAGTGFTLRTNLHSIITAGFTARSYGDSRYAMGTGDIDGSPATGAGENLDPNNLSTLILTYTRTTNNGKWDAGATWNREHVWPKFWLGLSPSQNGGSTVVDNSYKGVASDAFELLPATVSANSSRQDSGYGFFVSNGTPSGSYGNNTNAGTTYWYPGDGDRGDVARVIFYMATRWFDPTNPSRGTSNTNLELKNGAPALYNFGDLNSLLHWNYTDGVDNYERRRNQIIYGSSGDLTNHALNPSYYQANRNPFIDHPEYVWAVFGAGNNNSQISVGGAPAADGSSSTAVDLGKAIVGATLGTGSVVVNKAGANPTTFDVSASGVAATGASALQVGTGQPFDYNAGSKTMTVQLTASTATAGVKSGTVTINNTDLTTGGAGLGSADGNDTVNVTATVVDHSTGSLAAGSTVTSQAIDFGYVPQGFASRTASFAIANRPAGSGFTADLALNSITTAGSGSFTTNAATFGHLAAGSQSAYNATLNTGTAGTLAGTHTFNVGDEAIPGATAGPALGVTMNARVISSATFPVTGFIQLNSGETYNTGAFSIAGGVTLTKSGPGAMNVTGAQSNGANSVLAVTGGSVTLASDAGSAGSFPLAVSTVNAGATLTVLSAGQHLAGLTVGDNTVATVTAGGDKVLVAKGLTVGSLGKLDLNDNDAIVAAAAETVREYLLSGRAGGAWTGNGIVSTTAANNAQQTTGIAYAPGSLIGGTFDGESVEPTDVVLKYTWYGDANLNGAVDPDDYVLIDRGMGAHLTGWVYGDFDYSGTVDAADYLLLDTSFGLQAGILSPGMLADREARFGDAYVAELVAAVPEPAACLLAVVAPAFMMGRRRRGNGR